MSKFWQGRRVLVTGAGGFIGSHLAEELARRGAIVRAFVHYNALGRAGWLDESAKELRDSMDIVAGDLREYDVLNDAARECDTIFHLGALIAIPYSYRSPLGYVRTNVEGTVNVLEAARAAGVRRVINTSTSEVYGTAISVPIAETHPLQGQSPYAASKIGADAIAESYHRSFGVPVATARPFNTFGPRQSARAVIPAILAQLLAGVTELQLGNLTPTRDFNFVMNTVEGMLALGEAPDSVALGRTFNLGSNREISIGALANMLMDRTGIAVPITTSDARTRPTGSEVERLLADNSRAMAELKWKPRVTLEDGLDETIAWMRKRPAGPGAVGFVT
jgi:NAD dependent epimerase/dehydratase